MPNPHILVVDDEPDIRELVSEILEDEGYRVSTADNGESARAVYARHAPDVVLLDIWMPDVDGISLLKEWSASAGLKCPVIVMSGHGTVETAVEATRLGAHDFVQKPISLARLLSVVSQALAAKRPAGDSIRRAPAAQVAEPIGTSPAMQLLRSKAEQAAQHDSPVLITGEPGSGRETLARFIHTRSGKAGAFVPADPFELESDSVRAYLLGRDNGEDVQAGVLARAANGTVFLSDVQEMPPEARKAISQVLESGQFTPEGGSRPQPLTCRVIASGSADLLEQAKRDTTLEQLYYRLNVLPLQVPPLRNRPDDVPDLVRFYADWFPNNEGLPYRAFSVAAQNRLRNHGWPGNIRELRNLVQRLLILGGEGEVSVGEVEEALRHNLAEPAVVERLRPEIFDMPLREAREQFEREYLSHQLRKAGGSVGKLAEAVEMERTHLYRKLRALGIDPKAVVAEGGK